jgi:hypothetical protein
MIVCSRCKVAPSPRAANPKANAFCKPCAREYSREHYQRNKSTYARRAKRWREENRERSNETALRYYHTEHGKEKRQQYLLKHEYNLTVKEYNDLVQKQKGRCAICATKPRKLHVDHDHSTSKVRGLLCPNCNKAIGLLHDKPELMRAAASYLEAR